MPYVSVIVPNYNHAPFLKQRIDSILNQSFQDFELILLDDCSTDNSRDILNSYERNLHVSHVVFNEKNSGSPFAQWNKGMFLAQGDWIWIAESDDWADKHFLETLLNEAKSYPSVGLIYAKAQYVYPDGKTWSPHVTNKTTYFKGDDFAIQRLLLSNDIYNASMTLFKKSCWAQIDSTRYDKMRLCGDWFFYVLLCEHKDVLEVDKCLSYYRIHDKYPSFHAECDGLTFIEGLEVLDYIAQHYHISASRYSRHWGRMLAKYKKQYHYSKKIMNDILTRVRTDYKLMYVYFKIYNSLKK